MRGFREIDLDDADQGEVLLLIALPTEDHLWGVLAPLQNTPWGEQIQVVDGGDLSHALHGYATPLVRNLGSPPRRRARRMPADSVRCALRDSCPMAADHCVPGPGMPGCYQPPAPEPEILALAAVVARAWAEGRYVMVVEGEEFSF